MTFPWPAAIKHTHAQENCNHHRHRRIAVSVIVPSAHALEHTTAGYLIDRPTKGRCDQNHTAMGTPALGRSGRVQRTNSCPLWVMCGRRLGKDFLTVLQHWSGAGHASGWFMRLVWPLPLMLCADRVPNTCPLCLPKRTGAVQFAMSSLGHSRPTAHSRIPQPDRSTDRFTSDSSLDVGLSLRTSAGA